MRCSQKTFTPLISAAEAKLFRTHHERRKVLIVYPYLKFQAVSGCEYDGHTKLLQYERTQNKVTFGRFLMTHKDISGYLLLFVRGAIYVIKC